MAAALHREVTVAIDHARHDHRTAGIDHLGVRPIDLVVRADRFDLAIGDRHAHAHAQGIRRAIGEGGVVEDEAGHVVV